MSKLEKNDLIDWFVSGEKPREDWKIGTEHEKFVFHEDSFKRDE